MNSVLYFTLTQDIFYNVAFVSQGRPEGELDKRSARNVPLAFRAAALSETGE